MSMKMLLEYLKYNILAICSCRRLFRIFMFYKNNLQSTENYPKRKQKSGTITWYFLHETFYVFLFFQNFFFVPVACQKNILFYSHKNLNWKIFVRDKNGKKRKKKGVEEKKFSLIFFYLFRFHFMWTNDYMVRVTLCELIRKLDTPDSTFSWCSCYLRKFFTYRTVYIERHSEKTGWY